MEELEETPLYKKDNLVFAQSNIGFLQPAIVQKYLHNQKKYRVRFLWDNTRKLEIANNLMEYNPETLAIYRSLIEKSPIQEANRIEANIFLAERELRKQQKRYQDEKSHD